MKQEELIEMKDLIKTVYADPPWQGSNDSFDSSFCPGGRSGSKFAAYERMKQDEIKNMADWVKAFCHEDCHLWMWAISCKLLDALEVMKAWGFRYITNMAWVKMRDGKLQSGIGHYFRGSHELLLFGKRGKPPLKRPKPGELSFKCKDGRRVKDQKRKRFYVPSVILAERTKHSKKPEEVYDIIEKISYSPYLELFARHAEPRKDWAFWGNESGNKNL